MKIVITGAGSFAAFHLISKLLKGKHSVLGLDKEENENIKELLLNPDFTFKQVDLGEEKDLSRICKEQDIVYHLAAISSERLCRENPILSVKANILATLNMLEVARKLSALFVFSSSGSVYPASSEPKPEKLASFGDNFYGTSKFLAEKYCNLYHDNFKVDIVILRFSRIYGPRMKRNPIYDISMGLKERRTIKMYESLFSKYDFIYVKDVVKAFCLAQDKKWRNKTVNISSQKPYKLSEIYEIMTKLAEDKQKIEVLNNKESIDILNNEYAKSLGWQADYSIEDGLSETLDYFKE